MTSPRPWPNNAREIRDLAAEEAIAGRRAIEPLISLGPSPQITAEEQIRRLAQATMAFQTISRLLESAGAQTNPVHDQQYRLFKQ